MRPKVAISHVIDQNTYAALKEAIGRIGDLSKLIPPGSTVLIKPNYVMSPTERGITNPSVTEAVVRLAASASPGRLIIGEGSADSYTPTSFRLQNTYNLAARYDAECIDLNNDDTVTVPVSDETGRSRIMLPKTVALAVAGFIPEEQKQMEFCSRLGLGPCRLEEIDVVGESIESVFFNLQRIPENILELPLEYCLSRIHTDEFVLIERGLKQYGFFSADEVIGNDREPATAKILGVCLEDGFLQRALETLPENARALLRRFVDIGGTSNGYFKLLDDWANEYGESNSFWVGVRALIRLGLLFIFGSQHKPYIIFREGVIEAAKRVQII